MNVHEWAQRWNVPPQALQELLAMPMPEPGQHVTTEAATQQQIRLTASKMGGDMWRNNSGALTSDDGRHVRFGLGNDSKRINESFKSSDLIGITPVYVLPHHVGRLFGVFTAVEVKRGDWIWSGSDRETAQWKYLQLVQSKGGFSTFAKSLKDYQSCITV